MLDAEGASLEDLDALIYLVFLLELLFGSLLK